MRSASDPHIRPLERADSDQARAVLAAACSWDRAAEVADELLFGDGAQHPARALATTIADTIVALAVVSGPWLRVLAVHPEQRHLGVGTALLTAAERLLAQAVNRVAAPSAPMPAPLTIRVMDQPGNYLAPGVDVRNRQTIEWLKRRGYRVSGENCNLLVALRDNPRVSEHRTAELASRCTGYRIRRAHIDDRDWLAAAVAEQFSPAWAFEVARALSMEPSGVHIAVVDSAPANGPADRPQVAGFAAHDANNRGLGWFGPAGTWPQHRRRGLGQALLCACLTDVAQAGHDICEIAWIGPRAFYERTVGVCGERRFARLRKDIP